MFPGVTGGYLDGSALRRRYVARARKRAGLRPLRFHDLRHTFGTRMIAKADIRRVQEWMGHADVQTTMKYLHYAPRAEDAALSPRRSGASIRWSIRPASRRDRAAVGPERTETSRASAPGRNVPKRTRLSTPDASGTR